MAKSPHYPDHMVKASVIKKELTALSDPQKKEFLPRFFKTGKGEYGEGSQFLGVVIPGQRALVKKYKTLKLSELKVLLEDPYHECRMTALLFLVEMYKKAETEEYRKAVYDFYLESINFINNWDLVDLSAPQIIGRFLLDKDKSILYDFAMSENLWIQRIAVLSTFTFIKNKKYSDTLAIVRMLLRHPHDLIHKASGWMLREIGNRDIQIELAFLDSLDEITQQSVYSVMPRTMLRYAIEKFPENMRMYYLKGKTHLKKKDFKGKI